MDPSASSSMVGGVLPFSAPTSSLPHIPNLPAIPYGVPPPTMAGGVTAAPAAEAEDDEPVPENANETVYIRNLNEKVKLPVLKETLTNLFSLYGDVLSVTAHANVRMRGQAFVALGNKKAAHKAVKEVQGFPLYGRPVQVSFAKTLSDSIVIKKMKDAGEEPTEEEGTFQQHKKQRLEHKKEVRKEVRKKTLERKLAEKRAAAGDTDGLAAATSASAAQRRQNVQMPDEYVPPHKILFLQNIASKFGKDELEDLFSPLPNLVEVRTIPGKSDIAFVEFMDIPSSAAAREKLNGYAFPDGSKLKITYGRT
ncbi:hypothetical protein CF326_g43 [Tilletia indica]|uniref:RRM domain-containing protein n=1 Tax=Tilletia indica TaxID=43049 RepID=A0A177TTJ5_9BASI|nr:hypothetical protein CF326_g43 [Tilletia indica]KAE8243933.1 hypothetical protein A4X13_0g6882 [Tilletia indica]